MSFIKILLELFFYKINLFNNHCTKSYYFVLYKLFIYKIWYKFNRYAIITIKLPKIIDKIWINKEKY